MPAAHSPVYDSEGSNPELNAEGRRASPTSEQVLETIGSGAASRFRRWLWRLVVLFLLLGLGAATLFWRLGAQKPAGPSYVSAPARRGDLSATVTATGRLEALDQVDVGAEISGRITRVLVDFNDQVKQGQVLCEIDAAQFLATYSQARAQLEANQTELVSRKASLREAELGLDRTRALTKAGVASQGELEAAEAAFARAEAAVGSARAQIHLARAAVQSARTVLDKTKVRSPIDGIVLSRTVEPGQTVAATLAAPTLFTLARDVTHMELHIDIDEADIGRVEEGQKASFTVDAYAGRTFPAELATIFNVATTQDNVVTYEAVLLVDNQRSLLRPGMTATATIVTAERKQALLVPNAALRFTPPSELEQGQRGPPNPFVRRRPGSASKHVDQAAGPRVWILERGAPKAVSIKTGLSDGESTEVLAGDLKAGDQVLVDVIAKEA